MSRPRRVVNGCPNSLCWPDRSFRIPPPSRRRFLRELGIDARNRPPAGCDGFWRRCISQTCRTGAGNFEKRGPVPIICQKGPRGTGVRNVPLNPLQSSARSLKPTSLYRKLKFLARRDSWFTRGQRLRRVSEREVIETAPADAHFFVREVSFRRHSISMRD